MTARNDDVIGFGTLGDGFDKDVIIQREAQLLILAVCILVASLFGVRVVKFLGGYCISESGFFVLMGIMGGGSSVVNSQQKMLLNQSHSTARQFTLMA